jgi:hypothetical protein
MHSPGIGSAAARIPPGVAGRVVVGVTAPGEPVVVIVLEGELGPSAPGSRGDKPENQRGGQT